MTYFGNWAIVIGIDAYSIPDGTLRGTVSDALRMYEWLVDSNGGNVPPEHVLLFLSPSSSLPPSSLTWYSATKKELKRVIQHHTITKPERGQRLYVYFSGHGIKDTRTLSKEPVLLLADFELDDTENSFRFGDMRNFFWGTEFDEQFFFIDACRNIPENWNTQTFTIGQWPLVNYPAPGHKVQQFVFNATSPGGSAFEVGEAGYEQGVFTQALLEGLKDGKGKAKAYDPTFADYVVTVESLAKFISEEVPKKLERQALLTQPERRALLTQPERRALLTQPERRALLTQPERQALLTQPIVQVPQFQNDWVDNASPELKRIPAYLVPKERLEVTVDPPAVVPGVEITINRDGRVVEDPTFIQSDQDLPAAWHLPPRPYLVLGHADNYEQSKKRGNPVELYTPWLETIEFRPKSPPSSLSSSPPPSSPPSIPPSLDNGGADVGSQLPPGTPPPTATGGDEGRVRLRLTSDDPLAPLELASSISTVLKIGQGSLNCEDLIPGFYRARFRSPEDQGVEEVVELLAGEEVEMHIDAPSPPNTRLTRDLMQAAELSARPDKTLGMLGESPVSLVRPSTILALAGSVANGQPEFGIQLQHLGVATFRQRYPDEKMSGVQLLFAVDTLSPEEALTYLSQVEVRLWPQNNPRTEVVDSPEKISHINGLGQLVKGVPPGRYWLSLALPGKRPVVFSLVLLQHYLTMLVIYREPSDYVSVFQYLLDLSTEDALESSRVRQLELFQRFYLSGQLEHAAQNVDLALEGKWSNPIAGCLAGYLLLQQDEQRRSEKSHREPRLLQNVIYRYSPDLSDANILMADYAAYQGNDKLAVVALRRALDLGLPIFADGMTRLIAGLHRYQIKHPLVQAIADLSPTSRVQGLLWNVLYERPPSGLEHALIELDRSKDREPVMA